MLFELRLDRKTRLVTAGLAVAALAFALWQGPGLLRALRPHPPMKTGNSTPVDVLDLSLVVDASPSAARAYEVRAFISQSWRRGIGAGTMPVVFYMPSWGSRALDNETLLQVIANDGYLVLAVGDVAHDAPEPGESAETRSARVAPLDLYDVRGVEQLIRSADLKADLAARKISSLIDALGAPQDGPGSDIWKLADLKRIAAIGYSFGGSAAAEALRSDRRVVAAVNIDGWSFGSAAGLPVDKPYMAFSSTNSLPPLDIGLARRNTRAADRVSRARERAQLALPQSHLIVVRGTLHGDFSDRLHGGDRWTQWRPWQPPLANPARVRTKIDNAIRDFLASAFRVAKSVGPVTSTFIAR